MVKRTNDNGKQKKARGPRHQVTTATPGLSHIGTFQMLPLLVLMPFKCCKLEQLLVLERFKCYKLRHLLVLEHVKYCHCSWNASTAKSQNSLVWEHFRCCKIRHLKGTGGPQDNRTGTTGPEDHRIRDPGKKTKRSPKNEPYLSKPIKNTKLPPSHGAMCESRRVLTSELLRDCG